MSVDDCEWELRKLHFSIGSKECSRYERKVDWVQNNRQRKWDFIQNIRIPGRVNPKMHTSASLLEAIPYIASQLKHCSDSSIIFPALINLRNICNARKKDVSFLTAVCERIAGPLVNLLYHCGSTFLHVIVDILLRLTGIKSEKQASRLLVEAHILKAWQSQHLLSVASSEEELLAGWVIFTSSLIVDCPEIIRNNLIDPLNIICRIFYNNSMSGCIEFKSKQLLLDIADDIRFYTTVYFKSQTMPESIDSNDQVFPVCTMDPLTNSIHVMQIIHKINQSLRSKRISDSIDRFYEKFQHEIQNTKVSYV